MIYYVHAQKNSFKKPAEFCTNSQLFTAVGATTTAAAEAAVNVLVS